jgi:hypothetical protein
MSRAFKKISYVFGTAMLVLAISLMVFTVSAEESPFNIESVTIIQENNLISVSASVDKEYVKENEGQTVHLFRLPPNNDPENLSGLTPISSKEISDELDFTENFTKQLIYSSYILATQNGDGTYSTVSDNIFISNPQDIADNTEAFPQSTTKKGLVSTISADAQYLGVSHTTIDVEIEDYISPVKTDDTISHTFFGQTFYINAKKLSALDHKIRVYSDADINVYLNIILGKSTIPELDFLYYSKNDAASLFAINTKSVKSARHFAAFCDFLTSRYSVTDGNYGFVPGYILGYEINAAGKWGYPSTATLEEYTENYANAYRILYNAVKSTYANGRVYVSVSNLFNGDESTTDYGSREFLAAFAENMKRGSDTDWALAVNPYASDPLMTEFWNDTEATDNDDTKYVTLKNLDVLCKFMESEDMLYKGNVRSIIISEFGIHGDATDTNASERQAAAYALAYAIADTNPYVDAFIYYRHTDHTAENGKFGLLDSRAETKKSVYRIFRDADTANAAKGLEMAKSYSSAELYNKYLKDYSPKSKRITTEKIPMMRDEIPTKYTESVLFDMSAGSTCGFYPSDSAAYVELRPVDAEATSSSLYAVMKPVSSQTYMGISRSFTDEEKLEGDYITVYFTPITPTTQTLTVQFRLDGKADNVKQVFEASSQLSSNVETALTFKISDFVKLTGGKINSLRLWYRPSNNALEAGEYALRLDKITIHTSDDTNAFLEFVISLIPWLCAALVIGAIVYIYKNKRILNKIKEINGKTKYRILRFLRDKKIISGKYRKRKQRVNTENTTASVRKPNTNQRPATTRTQSTVRIVNGRVLPMKRTMQNEGSAGGNLQNSKNILKNSEKPESSGQND